MRRENLILGGVFIFLLILAFAFEPIMDWKKDLSRPDNFLSKVKVDDVVKVNIEKDGNKISLERQGDKWKIAETKDFYVMTKDETFASQLKDVVDAHLTLAGNNKDRKSDFQTDDSGAKIGLEDNNGLVQEFIVGKMTSDYSGSYISLPDSNETYSIDVNLTYLFNRDVSEWYDTSIFKSDTEKVNKIRFQYPKSEFSVEKKDDVWKGTLPYSFSVDKEKIDKIVEVMTSLNAVDVPEQTFEGTGLENHAIIVEVSGDGISDVLMVGGVNEDGNYFAKKGSSDNIYLITPEQKEMLDTSIRSLR